MERSSRCDWLGNCAGSGAKNRPRNTKLSPIQFGARGRSVSIISLYDTPRQLYRHPKGEGIHGKCRIFGLPTEGLRDTVAFVSCERNSFLNRVLWEMIGII